MAQPQPPQFQPQPFTPSPSPQGMPLPPTTQPQQQPSQIAPGTVQFLTYENRDVKIRFNYPSYWRELPVQPPEVVAFHSPQTSAAVVVRVFPVQPGTALEQTIPIKINTFSSFFPSFQLIGSTHTPIDGKDGHQVMFSYTGQQGNPFISWNLWTISNDAEYEIRYVAPANQ